MLCIAQWVIAVHQFLDIYPRIFLLLLFVAQNLKLMVTARPINIDINNFRILTINKNLNLMFQKLNIWYYIIVLYHINIYIVPRISQTFIL